MKRLADYGYNERLFAGGLRAKIHFSRFHWLTRSLERLEYKPRRVLELGCFDGKTIDFLPQLPETYVGLDANWEGGLDIARERWKGHEDFRFLYCMKPADIALNESFDLAICMETLEHVPPEMVEPYLAKLSAITDGYILITVPNEKGLVFALKYLIKKIGRGDTFECTPAEFLNQTIGRMDRVHRHEHKGFDYDRIIDAVAKYFDIVDLSSYPLRFLPTGFSFGVGIVGRTTNNKKTREP